MQGYDSVAINADVEIGGFDQLFNLKAGRYIQKHYGKKEQNILTFSMLEGTDGRKMSTSWGNIITLVDEPNDMYGKIMSLKDELIVKYFTLTTDLSLEEIALIEKAIKKGENPKIYKMRLAREIVTMYHSEKAAAKAEEQFENVFAKGALPESMPELFVSVTDVAQELKRLQIIESKSEWTRLVKEGAVSVHEGEVIQDPKWLPQTSCVLKIGKRRFVRFV
jgi:tyrosyl-tRNA synthetase